MESCRRRLRAVRPEEMQIPQRRKQDLKALGSERCRHPSRVKRANPAPRFDPENPNQIRNVTKSKQEDWGLLHTWK